MASSASSDEGEIRDSRLEKANTSLSQFDGSSVDRQDRTRRYTNSISPAPENGSYTRRRTARSRSPPSRGSKRPRDDDYLDRGRGDSRKFKVHYEESQYERRQRPRVSYADVDHGNADALRYDDRPRNAPRRSRTRSRSRSPYRAPRRDERRDEYRGGGDRYDNRADGSSSRPREFNGHRDQYSRDRPGKRDVDSRSNQDSELQKSRDEHTSKPTNEVEETQVDYDAEPVDEAALIEQRRKRREAIKAKYRGSATPLLVQALHIQDKSGAPSPGVTPGGEDSAQPTRSVSPVVFTPTTPKDMVEPASPSPFAITNDQDLANTNGDAMTGVEDGPSAADYDPTMDMQDDRRREKQHDDDMASGSYDETKTTAAEQDVLLPTVEDEPVPEPPKKKDEFDMFAEDDDDDMFAEESPVKKESHLAEPSKAVPILEGKTLDIGMLDNWDDPEGYYKVILGELLSGRYHVQANLGRGMFSGVVRATDTTTQKLVAIKIIRNNETMRKAGIKEIEILEKINAADPDDRKHMIRLERHFEHKGHLCMVFEHLSINLREVLKKFGRDVGINLRAVRAYAQQMFLGLSLMRKCNILHADLKPDNILVNEGRNMLKICDLGSASDASENEITPYLVSRFYRAPEIILGMPYDFALDIWSVGCTLYELYTGKILFTGRSNNQMLKSVMECRGRFTTKMLKRSTFAGVHFDENGNFRSVEVDKLTGKEVVKMLTLAKPTRDLRTRLLSASKDLSDDESKELNLFVDLLDRCLTLNPEKRITPSEALKHPFILRNKPF